MRLTKEALITHLREAGLTLVGWGEAKALTEDVGRFQSWQNAGFAADMEFMKTEAGRFFDPTTLLSTARSVIVVSVFYDRTPAPVRPSGFGRVARYAWGRDYHRVINRRLRKFIRRVQQDLKEEFRWRAFTDAMPFAERAFAKDVGLGFIGKNTMLIRPGEGSYSFLAEVVWEVEIVGSTLAVSQGGCGSCTRCVKSCPTGAIVSDYQVDARKCISYLNVEKSGMLTVHEMRSLRDWVLGCDVCQEVCPFNHTPVSEGREAAIPELARSSGAGGILDLAQILNIREDVAFWERFKGSGFMRPGREGILRNAAIVAANTGAKELRPLLLEVGEIDSSPVVRETALWAAGLL